MAEGETSLLFCEFSLADPTAFTQDGENGQVDLIRSLISESL